MQLPSPPQLLYESTINLPLWAKMSAKVWPMRAIGGIWITMAMPCLFAPESVLRLCMREEARAAATKRKNSDADDDDDDGRGTERLLMRCFGAQAAVCALLLCTARLDQRGYKIFGAAMLPFFCFDWMAYRAGYLNKLGALGDLAGNVAFVALSAIGAGLVLKDA